MAGANTIPRPYIPMAVPILCRGTIRYTIVSVTTGSNPPGIAWITRKAIKLLRPHASPQSAEARAKPPSAIMYTRSSPNRSPNQALAGTITPRTRLYAVVIHATSAVLPPKSDWMVAIATFTMLTSRMDMNMPPINTASGIRHPPDGGAGTGSAWLGDGSPARRGRSAARNAASSRTAVLVEAVSVLISDLLTRPRWLNSASIDRGARSCAAVLRRREGDMLSSPSDDEVGGYQARSARSERSERSNQTGSRAPLSGERASGQHPSIGRHLAVMLAASA